jgi:hypothetical protein
MSVKKNDKKVAKHLHIDLSVVTYNPLGLAGAIAKACERYKLEGTTVGMFNKR